MSEAAQQAAKEISVYLLTGMHHTTVEGQTAISAIIDSHMEPIDPTCISAADYLDAIERSRIRATNSTRANLGTVVQS